MHRVPATGGTFKPAIASITEFFVIEFSNVCFWLTKWFFKWLGWLQHSYIDLKNATRCSHGCVSFFAECSCPRRRGRGVEFSSGKFRIQVHFRIRVQRSRIQVLYPNSDTLKLYPLLCFKNSTFLQDNHNLKCLDGRVLHHFCYDKV